MNLVLSHPTSRGGGSLLLPVTGVAHIAGEDGIVVDVRLAGVTIDALLQLDLAAEGLSSAAEIWFEDVRERSH